MLFVLVNVYSNSCRPTASADSPAPPTVDTFNYVLGTQTFGASYQFTQATRLVETAEAIREMGSNVVKFQLNKQYYGPQANVPKQHPGVHSLTDLVRDEPSHRRVLDMPFAYYVLWTYPFADGDWHRGLSTADQAAQYREVYTFAGYLLKTYSGSGKRFFLGHWEGDWWLRGIGNTKDEERVTSAAIRGMIDWLNVRQKAIEDARQDIPHADVQVFQYTEVNLASLAMEGRKTVTNDVLPQTSVDYVSYSCYDTQKDPLRLKAALDYIESKLPAKPSVRGKRVFLGEYGFPTVYHSPEQQDELSRQVIRAGWEWGCPLILYWELYNNEVDKDGRQRGFWMIDDHGVKQPIYETHRRFYEWAKQYASDGNRQQGRRPTLDEFRPAALEFLKGLEPGRE